MEFINQPAPVNRLGDYLNDNLSANWTHFRAAVAFVKRSGTRHIAPALAAFARVGHVEIIAGIDHRGTSAEGLRDLLDAVHPEGRIVVFHNRLPFTFHPKVYLFRSPDAADVFIGSGNLTEGGLFTNYEAGFRLPLDLGDPKQAAILQSIEEVLDSWADLSTGTALVLDNLLLARITALGLVPSEALAVSEPADMEEGYGTSRSTRPPVPFAARVVSRAPPIPGPAPPYEATTTPSPPPQPSAFNATGFVMTLQRTDVGVGQTTAGTSRRSPEIFVPLAARDAEPGFWDWPGGFASDPPTTREARPPRGAYAFGRRGRCREHDDLGRTSTTFGYAARRCAARATSVTSCGWRRPIRRLTTTTTSKLSHKGRVSTRSIWPCAANPCEIPGKRMGIIEVFRVS